MRKALNELLYPAVGFALVGILALEVFYCYQIAAWFAELR